MKCKDCGINDISFKGLCKNCYQKLYRKKNKEYRKKYITKYYQVPKNRKRKRKIDKECRKRYYRRNKEEILKKQKEEYQKNKYKIIKQKKGYYQNNKEKIVKQKREYRKKPENKVRAKEYHQKLIKKENERRKKLGLPLVGEGWISECEMFRILKKIMKSPMIKHDRTVLDGLELDAYFSKLKLAFEYMGKQHYEWIKFFHKTEEEFKVQQYRDKCKKKLCKMLGITLIRIKYDEELSEQLVLSKLKHFNLPIVQKKI